MLNQRSVMDGSGIMIMLSLLMFFVVSADKSLMTVNDASDAWIVEKNFANMIEVSLNLSVCTNVFLSGISLGVKYLFNAFLQAYPYEYMLNGRTYECTGYFMVSTSAATVMDEMQSVPTKISSTELLIVVDDEVEESTELFNVSRYENANVNIAAVNGLWTLSENYLYPRKFNKVSSCDETLHKRGIRNLQGRELQVATVFNRPVCYLNSTVKRTVNGIERDYFIAEDESELDGIEIKLFLLMAEILNFTWSIQRPSDHYRYGKSNGTAWHGGIIGQIYRKEVDIAFSGIWLELAQYRVTNLTMPWTQLDVRFLVPRPKPYTSFWALTRPLSPKVWIAVVAMLIAQSIYVYTRAWVNPRIPKRFRSFFNTSSELMVRLLGTSGNKRIQGFELQFHLWHMIGVLLVTAYSSSLAASLTGSTYEHRNWQSRICGRFLNSSVNRVESQRNRLIHNSFLFYTYENICVIDPWANQFLERFETETDEADRHNKIMKGHYAILGRIVGSIFFPENVIRDEDLKDYRVMRDHVGRFFTSFAVQPWLLNFCDLVILWLREFGFVDYHLRNVIQRRTGSAYREVLVEYDILETGPRVLEITPLGAGFSMLAVGLILSTMVFYLELKSVSSKEKPIVDVLRNIEKKRKLWNARKLKFKLHT